ncbi:uncharacterized protein LOC126979330 [Leptidea sinapis]|uniref:uncharacterized protein LOC126979330 n=1 Tax=Leptidea sinapis TaxID=189913 RepID=UPI002146EE9F|nr:uncharacterized protein LOC126979330 [Leptidea sinapis]
MAENDNLIIAVTNISSEIDVSRINAILTDQWIKAQAYLDRKLKEQVERQSILCSFIHDANSKLETEIKIAQSEFESLKSAFESIKSANIEIKTKHLLTKEKKKEIKERVSSGIKKYENSWVESKKKYDNIPLIKKYSDVQNKRLQIVERIRVHVNNANSISEKIYKKKAELVLQDRKRIIEVADLLLNERPKLIQAIIEKYNGINKIKKNIQNMLQNESIQNVSVSPFKVESIYDAVIIKQLHDPKQNEDIFENYDNMQKLQVSQSNEFDTIKQKLDQIKKDDFSRPMKRINSQNIVEPINKRSMDKSIIKNQFNLSFFSIGTKIGSSDFGGKRRDYSLNKIIHIIDDVKLNANETYNLLKNANPQNLQGVNAISPRNAGDENKCNDNVAKIIEVDEHTQLSGTEEIVKGEAQDIILPPTNFMDSSKEAVNGNN